MNKKNSQKQYGLRISVALLIWIGIIVFISLAAQESTGGTEQVPGILSWLYETGGKWLAGGVFTGAGLLLAAGSRIALRK